MSRTVCFAAQKIIDTIKAEGLSLGVLVLAENAVDFNDDESRAVSKAIEHAGGNYYVNDGGDWVVSDVPLGDYRDFGFNFDADIEDGDVLVQGGRWACLWRVSKADRAEYPSGWCAQVVETINEAGGIQMGALIYDLSHPALKSDRIRHAVRASYFSRHMQALWTDCAAELAKYDAE